VSDQWFRMTPWAPCRDGHGKGHRQRGHDQEVTREHRASHDGVPEFRRSRRTRRPLEPLRPPQRQMVGHGPIASRQTRTQRATLEARTLNRIEPLSPVKKSAKSSSASLVVTVENIDAKQRGTHPRGLAQ